MGSDCEQLAKCLEIIELILDNEGSSEQEAFLFEHIKQCSCCLEHYNVEAEFHKLVKTRISKEPVPVDLVKSIRNKILG